MSAEMREFADLTANEHQKLLIGRLQKAITSCQTNVTRSNNIIFSTDDPEIFCGYFLETFKKHGQNIVDCAARIYWTPFTDADEAISQSAPYETIPLKEWEMSAIFVGFDKICKSWPSGGLSFSNEDELDHVFEEIASVVSGDGIDFFDKYASVQGLFDFITDHGPSSPGTWRITLEFLLRDRLFGISSACRHLKGIQPPDLTGYEFHQRNWLLRNKCQIIS